MSLTGYRQVDDLINKIRDQIQVALEGNLIGLYLYGSATGGDFDPKLSDVDLIAVLKKNVASSEFNSLEKMHRQLATENPEWSERIEVVYTCFFDLKNFRLNRHEVAAVSPGEPFHLKQIGEEWLINWYVAQQNSIKLLGPDPKTIFPDISAGEYREAIKNQARLWSEALAEFTPKSTRGPVAYAIFTLCRAMYSHEHGKQASKKKSAEWVVRKFPQWANLINEAIEWRKVQWRKNQDEIGDKLPTALDFLEFSIDQVTK